MATSKQAGQNKQGNIVIQDNKNANRRFGFGGVGPITSAPKTGDMFYIEFHDIKQTTLPGTQSSTTLPFNRFAKGVSGVSVATTTQPIDRYGKRVYVPTRVDFPEVQLSMYDVVDGEMFTFAMGIYNQFFKNGQMGTSSSSIENALRGLNHGRKFSTKGKAFHQSFEKVTIFHFFVNLDAEGGAEETTPSSGGIQKIELINPLVTNITFSPSDYSDGNLRTIELALQPENVVFSTVSDSVTLPTWLMDGLPLELESAISDIESGDYTNATVTRMNELLKSISKPSQFDPENDETMLTLLNNNQPTLSQTTTAQNSLINQQKLDELAKLNRDLQFSATTSPDADGQADIIRQQIEEAKSRHQFVEAVPTDPRFDDTFVPETKYPQVADFANLGNTYDGGTGRYGGSNLGGAIKNELVNAFFNGRKINWGNIRNSAAQGIVGNSGIGTLQNLSKTSQSKYGIAGDLIRDGIKNAGTASGGQIQTTTVPSNITANSTSATLNSAQSNINVLKNLTRGIR